MLHRGGSSRSPAAVVLAGMLRAQRRGWLQGSCQHCWNWSCASEGDMCGRLWRRGACGGWRARWWRRRRRARMPGVGLSVRI
eukprot:4112771-Prymnesium_polylepis.1